MELHCLKLSAYHLPEPFVVAVCLMFPMAVCLLFPMQSLTSACLPAEEVVP